MARQEAAVEGTPTLVNRAITRAFSERYAAAAEDVERIIDATYRVIERTGTVDPKVRDILVEAGLSSPAFYRHFASKDELMLVIFDDGRRRQADYLAHRMARARDTRGRVREWVEGVAQQAVDRSSASRTRPFVANAGRLADQFPAEHARSQELILALLVDALDAGTRVGEVRVLDVRRDAQCVYDLTFGFMQRHVLARTTPTRGDVDHLVTATELILGLH